MANSPAGSILSKIYEKTKFRPDMVKERAILPNKDRCFVYQDYKMVNLLTSDQIFMIGGRSMANIFMGLSFMADRFFKKVWISQSLYDFNQVIYFRADKPRIGKE